MDENECRMCCSMLFSNLFSCCVCVCVYVCCCLSLDHTTKRRENIYRQSVCANFLVSMISQHSNNGFSFFFCFFFCFCFCDCCSVGVPFNTQHNVRMSLVCNPCSIYCMLSFPFHADTSFFQSTFSQSIL